MAKRLLTAVLAAFVVALVVVPPVIHFRWVHTDTRRLREVTPGRVYRCGQMTADGFAEAVRRYGIRTVINLQNEFDDPEMPRGFLDPGTVRETKLCKDLGLRYEWIAPDLLPRKLADTLRPAAVDQFLEIMDDPEAYPVLIHCRAGLHRTGCMVAVYRMEYEGWSPSRAIDEMKANGFGEWGCTSANDYVTQYVLNYQPNQRLTTKSAPPAGGGDE